MENVIKSGQIKNLVFDVGSVLIGFRWIDMFNDHGTDAETALRIGQGLFNHPDWQRFDAGFILIDELIDNFCKREPELEEEARWFLSNAIEMRVPRPKVWDEIKRLKDKGYKLYILSNYSKYLFETHTSGYPFREWMDGEVVSYMINVTKPDKGIYEYLLDTYSLKADECLFFDDRLENVEAAKSCGLYGIHVKDESEALLLEWLKKL